MGVSGTLVSVGTNSLIYLLQSTLSGEVFGGTITMPYTGLALDGETTGLPGAPVSGAFRQVLRASTDGIGIVAPETLTQGQARDLMLADDSGGTVGNSSVPRALAEITRRTASASWLLDADGTGLIVTASASPGTAYIRINLRYSLWY